MSDQLDLEERLAAYGTVLQQELASWPNFNPTTVAAPSPLLLLRRRLGRWSGAGHRPLLALATLVVGIGLVVALVLSGGDAEDAEGADGAQAEAMGAAPRTAAPAAATPTDGAGDDGVTAPAVADTDAVADDVGDDDSPAEPVTTDGGSERGPGEAGAPAASAPSGRCRDGLLVNGRCRIATAVSPLARSEACVEQGGVDDGEAGCFRVVDAVASCPDGAELRAGTCAVVSSPRPVQEICPAASELVGQVCERTAPPALVCEAGELVLEGCRVERAPAAGGDLACPGGGPAVGGQCTVTAPGSCATGRPSAGGCAIAAPVDVRETCPTATVLRNSQCEPPSGCPTTSKVTSDCGSPPVTERVCTATGQLLEAGECVQVVAVSCPAGFQATGAVCAGTTPASPVPFTCPPGQDRTGTSCFETAMPVPVCVEGALVADRCVVSEPAASVSACRAGATLEGAACVEQVEAELACAVGTLVDGSCRVVLDLDADDLCVSGARLEHGWCVRFEPPTDS